MESNSGFATLALLLLIGLSTCWAASVVHREDRENPMNASMTKIYGGVELTPNEWPHLVHVTYYDGGVLKQLCGGSVISDTYILSAAHCYTRRTADELLVIGAEHSFRTKEKVEQRKSVAEIITHPSYRAGIEQNDVAMLRLASPLSLKYHIKLVQLNYKDNCPAVSDQCTVAGWGTTETTHDYVDKPRKVTVSISNQGFCKQAYGSRYTEDQVCGVDPGKDACQGDSGGPLMCVCGRVNVQAGIVSYGRGCANVNAPGVYARVSSYTNWVSQVVRGGGRPGPGPPTYIPPELQIDPRDN